MGENLSGKILGVQDQITGFWQSLSLQNSPFVVLDILIVALIIYWGYLLIKETRAMRILYGIAFLGLIALAGQILQLSALNFVLKYLMTMIVVAIPVVFQPELRSALERLGRAKIVSEFSSLRRSEINSVVSDIVQAANVLARHKTGALIVLAQQTGLKDIIEKGKKLDARLTPELLITIFSPKTPLHDGAVIINGNIILAANCMLPLSDDEFTYNIGSRHRAAIGLTSQTDAIVIIISEERGSVSVSFNGQISRDLAPKELEEFLLNLLQRKTATKNDQDHKIKTHNIPKAKK